MTMIAREQVKSYLRGSPSAYWAAAVIYENALYPGHIVRQGLARRVLGLQARTLPVGTGQTVSTWGLSFPHGATRPVDLIRWLRAQDIQVKEGGHTFYLPPQPTLRPLLGEMVGFYPESAGFKILKDFREPTRARYLYRHRRWLRILQRLIGTPQNQLVAANYMYSLGIGPRIWDLACWRSRRQCYTVFVVEHVVGETAHRDSCAAFLERLRDLNANSHLRILIPEWERHEDFMLPDCHGNLFCATETGRVLYVDFQNFGLTSQRAWWRDVAARQPIVGDGAGQGMVGRPLIDVVRNYAAPDRRIVAEAVCRDGRTLLAALAAGAGWAIGWCAADEAPRITESLLASGATRFSVIPAERGRPLPAAGAVPPHLRSRLDAALLVYRSDAAVAEADRLLDLPWHRVVCVDEPAADRLTARTSRFDVIARPSETPSGVTVFGRRHA